MQTVAEGAIGEREIGVARVHETEPARRQTGNLDHA